MRLGVFFSENRRKQPDAKELMFMSDPNDLRNLGDISYLGDFIIILAIL